VGLTVDTDELPGQRRR